MRNLIFSIVAVIVTLTMMLALSEVALRLAGKSPWEDSGRTDDPVMHEPDAVLGWRSKAGNYEVPPRVKSGEAARLTFLENGRRVTSRKSATPDGEANGIPELILVGGSFTQGWAISDDETFAWKLQERFPNLEVKNYGTGGYGTYQALLTMRRVLPQQESPKLVVYGFHSMLPRKGGRPNRLRLLWDYYRTPRFSPFSLTTHNRSVLGFNLSFLFDRSELMRAAMTQLMQWLQEDRIQPLTTQGYSFDQVAQAHRDLESGRTVGKLVLLP